MDTLEGLKKIAEQIQPGKESKTKKVLKKLLLPAAGLALAGGGIYGGMKLMKHMPKKDVWTKAKYDKLVDKALSKWNVTAKSMGIPTNI